MKRCAIVAAVLVAGFGAGLPAASANVTLPAVISDNMVLQSGKPLPIWGWADPGEEVKVSLEGVTATATADAHGNWSVRLPARKASRSPVSMIVAGKNSITVQNILVGEVWLGSGQSNMQWSVQASSNAQQEIADANHPEIRLFLVPLVPSGKPARNVNARWVVCTPQSVPTFSAVLYFFGREIHKSLDVPVGLIATSWGGTRIEPWIPPAGFEGIPELANEVTELRKSLAAHKEARIAHLKAVKAWVEESERLAAAGHELADPPAVPNHPLHSNGARTGLYNGMVHALVPFAIQGALWYQGESNRGQGMYYYQLMRGLITGWRKVWSQEGDFAFLFVQLAPFRYGNNPTWLPEIWEAQTAALAVPNTGMAVTTDIATVADIHPPNKQDVGKRLALWALAYTYGKKEIVYSGPLYEDSTVEQGKIRIRFKHAAGGLAARDGKALNWFSIAGEDKKFVAATAVIDGETVLVSAPGVSKPVAVRFGWHETAEPNLVNKAGLPASPFRTDRWTDAINADLAGR